MHMVRREHVEGIKWGAVGVAVGRAAPAPKAAKQSDLPLCARLSDPFRTNHCHYPITECLDGTCLRAAAQSSTVAGWDAAVWRQLRCREGWVRAASHKTAPNTGSVPDNPMNGSTDDRSLGKINSNGFFIEVSGNQHNRSLN